MRPPAIEETRCRIVSREGSRSADELASDAPDGGADGISSCGGTCMSRYTRPITSTNVPAMSAMR
jgi:hypothetical protein